MDDIIKLIQQLNKELKEDNDKWEAENAARQFISDVRAMAATVRRTGDK